MNIEIMIAIRRMSGLDQDRFASKIGISVSLLEKVESGVLPLSERTASKIIHAFQLSERDIIDLSEMVEQLKEK